jgi:hypothetical protein
MSNPDFSSANSPGSRSESAVIDRRYKVGAANTVWIVILTLAGVGGSLIISCVTPFVALAVALAGTVRLTVAIRAMIVIWMANQFVGFLFLHFPWTAFTVQWGLALCAAAILTACATAAVLKLGASLPVFARLVLAILVSFLVYEVSLFVASLFLGGLETFSPAAIGRIGLSNLVWFAGIIALNELLTLVCKPWLAMMPRLARAS